MIDFGLENSTNYLIATDVSGGIPEVLFEQMKTMIEENLKDISGYNARIANFDHSFHYITTVTEENISNYKTIHTGMVGGGTDISVVVANLMEDEELVILSDGYMYGIETLENIKDRVTIVLFNDTPTMSNYILNKGFKNVVVVK
ncbi:hypothetical protein FDI40_gp152 [Agrobacterium phage Atu_ph07]|uniref:Uncharacterized protein n=1 Tax=Agrobacterium phage Atu_ph07 TaxID=2024264 RepID=A0A2L0UZH0_9CAUD|nr:hypothetical protein FDI40_gp152 [Agrobacterium phage Atu_ph07]AUZ94934.1 hypothetical protein [Agrobacterium phage Atu_ph07]